MRTSDTAVLTGEVWSLVLGFCCIERRTHWQCGTGVASESLYALQCLRALRLEDDFKLSQEGDRIAHQNTYDLRLTLTCG